eukprot:TRINITY_DN224_c0_g1_i3.p1 TRINITY_DN224_c0_g1~~TRINITY_DN224_c0_g1_i3.p1  ORF type:complete len:340 (+),score=91.13 TRINITY_DN224_c0_g1_i3:37-1056(+)
MGNNTSKKNRSSSKKHKKEKEKEKEEKEKKDLPRFTHDPSSNLNDFYEITEHVLGKGNFSSVHLAVSKETRHRVAIKVIQKLGAKNKPEMLKNEVQILKKMEHPYIIKLYDIFETDTTLYLVMELVTGGELFDRIVEREQYSEENAKQVMKQLFSAIEYFHSLDIVHRDLKPENLLLENETDDTNIKVTDFGLSRIYNDDMMQTACGTPGYVAPEVLECKGYDKEVDMWSAGVILYILLCGYPPFYSENEPELFESIMTASYTFHSPYWDHISTEAKDLISHLLVVSPKERLAATEALQHSWFTIDSEDARAPLNSAMREKLKHHNSERKSMVQVYKKH